MSADRRRQIDDLCRMLADVPAEERERVLGQRAGGDETLIDAVRARLVELAGSTAVWEAEQDPTEASTVDAAGDRGAVPFKRIGRYHLRRVMASGGMGTVYEAVQESPRRKVALKVMRRGIASHSALRRFEFESQILARLRHPNIAQVYEAGTHDDGRGGVPFFAMEYVPAAKTLTSFAREHRLGTEERLAIFVKVCDAVHHGHQKGIIHRDLKPANILVDSSGEPKIIDFGVARATDSDMAITTLQTDVGQLVGTLQYMSPEQCEADPDDLDTRSDVYALGVVLYELLCDQLPYDVSRVAVYEAARMIREQAPARPSSVKRALRGEIETIALKTLEKDRNRRYRSAAELADDVRRYLTGDPVLAEPPSVLYQVRLLARKHRAAAGAISAVAAVLVIATVVSTIFAVAALRASSRLKAQQTRTAEQRDLAIEAERDAERERNRAVWKSYVAGIAGAAANMEAQRFAEARRILDRCPQQHRAWEWSYLTAASDRSTGAATNVSVAALSADGERVVLQNEASRGTIVRVEDLIGTDHLTPDWRCPPALAWSPDLELAVRRLENGREESDDGRGGRGRDAGAANWTAEIVRTVDGVVLHTIGPRDLPFTEPRFSENGRFLVVLWEDGWCDRLQVQDWAPAGSRQLDAQDVLALSPDGRTLVARIGRKQGETSPIVTGIYEFDTGSRRVLSEDLSAAVYSRDSRRLAVASSRLPGSILVMDGGKTISTQDGIGDQVSAMAFSPDDATLAVGFDHGVIECRDASSGVVRQTLTGHDDRVLDLRFGADGRHLLSNTGQDFRRWTLDALPAHWMDSNMPVRFGAFVGAVRDGTALLVISGEQAALYDRAALRMLASARLRHGWTDPVRRVVATSPDGRCALMTNVDRTEPTRYRLRGPLDGSDRVLNLALEEMRGLCRSAAINAGGSRILISDAAGLSLVDGLTGRRVRFEAWDGLGPASIALTPDGGTELMRRPDRRRWLRRDAAAPAGWRPVGAEPPNEGRFTDLTACSTDSSLFAAVCTEAVMVWSLRDPDRPPVVIPMVVDRIESMCFSPDGARLVTGGTDRRVDVWDVATGDLMLTLPVDAAEVFALRFTDDGQDLLAATVGGFHVWCSTPAPERERERQRATPIATAAQELIADVTRDEFSHGRALAAIEHDGSIDPAVQALAADVLRFRGTDPARDAEQLVTRLYDRFILRDVVHTESERLTHLPPDLREAVRAEVDARTDDWRSLYQRSWNIVRRPEGSYQDYERGLRGAEAALVGYGNASLPDVLEGPGYGDLLNALGVAQYRIGHFEDAVETLRQASAAQGPHPANLAFSAMAHYRLGELAAAATIYRVLEETIAQSTDDPEAHGFLREAGQLLGRTDDGLFLVH